MDRTDLEIINELRKNSRITMKELGERVHLTGQATSERVIKLEEKGVIKRYTIDTDDVKLGYDIHAFITVITQDLNHKPYLTFIRARGEHIISHYNISGDGCYLLESKFNSYDELDKFLVDLNEFANYKLQLVIN